MKTEPVKRLFLITGTTRGIGKALLRESLEQPQSFVVSFSRSAACLKGRHQNIFIDLNDSANLASVFDAIRLDARQLEHLEKVVLINNAGVLDPISPIWACKDDLLVQNVSVNLIAPLILSRHFFHYAMPFPCKKWIVNITSGASHTPYFGWSAYGASKAGLDMATQAMSLEFSRIDSTFHVCAIAPGTVDTGMQDKIRACTHDQFEQVEKFVQLKESGALFSPEWTAGKLIQLVLDEKLENGGRYDLREMTLR